jgi:hypothetical protein
MVKAGRTIATLCLGWMILLPGGVRAQSGDVEQVLTQLNAAAAKFLSAQADFTWDQFTVAVVRTTICRRARFPLSAKKV